MTTVWVSRRILIKIVESLKQLSAKQERPALFLDEKTRLIGFINKNNESDTFVKIPEIYHVTPLLKIIPFELIDEKSFLTFLNTGLKKALDKLSMSSLPDNESVGSIPNPDELDQDYIESFDDMIKGCVEHFMKETSSTTTENE